MTRFASLRVSLILLLAFPMPGHAAPYGAADLETTSDPVDDMLDGLHRFLDRKTAEAVKNTPANWGLNTESVSKYHEGVQPGVDRFKEITGWIEPDDARLSLEFLAHSPDSAPIYQDESIKIVAVRWPVVAGLDGEGLLLLPAGNARAACVAIPDADQTPEMLAGLQPSNAPCNPFALELARQGFALIVPALINRRDDFSGNPRIGKMTNQPHREFIYRMAFELGGHIIGMECAKAAAALRCLEKKFAGVPLGLAGYGEGGLVAFHTGAIEQRADAVMVSGYFAPREKLWREPIYRNVWGLLADFGDAQIAWMIAPRGLVVEAGAYPSISGPPNPHAGRGGAAPGILARPSEDDIQHEFVSSHDPFRRLGVSEHIRLISDPNQGPAGSPDAIRYFMEALGLPPMAASTDSPAVDALQRPDDADRQKRQFDQMAAYVQRELRYAATARRDYARKVSPQIDAADAASWGSATAPLRDAFYNDVIGRFDDPFLSPNPRMRMIEDAPGYRVWEVMLDVFPDVCAYGWLLEPKDIKPGERRPVVVTQHGLEGRPADTLDLKNPYYRGFSRTIADLGYIVFAPQNPYIGEDRFRSLQRKLNPLGKTLFSIITPQHTQIINWLHALPIVDPDRIAFYGLSYGGKTAMRVPALETRYCLSICSGDFNEWIVKNATYDSPYSYLFTGEYEIFEWNLGRTFNYAEMAALIAPRPFMVERGHHDGVAPDEWVAAEYAKVQALYDRLDLGERTEIEYFNGPHQINAKGTLEFLRTHLGFPNKSTP